MQLPLLLLLASLVVAAPPKAPQTKKKAPEPAAVVAPAPEPAPEPTPAPAPVVAPPAPAPAVTTTAAVDPPPERRVLRVAVRDFAVSSTDDERLGRIVTDAVVAEIRKLQRVSVTSMEEVRTLFELEAEKQLAGCSEGACISELVEALGVDVIVAGSLVVVDNERVFTIKLLDQQQQTATQEISQRLRIENGEESLAMVGPAVAKLFPTLPLRVGAVRGVAPELGLRLNPPPLPPWVVFVGGAATTVAVAVGLVATSSNITAWNEADKLVAAATPTSPVNGAALAVQTDEVERSFNVLAVAFGAAAVVGAGTGVAALFTNWNGSTDVDEAAP